MTCHHCGHPLTPGSLSIRVGPGRAHTGCDSLVIDIEHDGNPLETACEVVARMTETQIRAAIDGMDDNQQEDAMTWWASLRKEAA